MRLASPVRACETSHGGGGTQAHRLLRVAPQPLAIPFGRVEPALSAHPRRQLEVVRLLQNRMWTGCSDLWCPSAMDSKRYSVNSCLPGARFCPDGISTDPFLPDPPASLEFDPSVNLTCVGEDATGTVFARLADRGRDVAAVEAPDDSSRVAIWMLSCRGLTDR